MKSKVTVIVPVYNAGKYLEECLDSLTGQTMKEIEIICVNDGSIDNSAEILAKYQKKDKRIKVLNQENSGRSAARNAGLRQVQTPYVMFCDADDEYDLIMCEKMVKALEKSGADLAICGISMSYEAHSEMRDSDEYYYKIRFDGKRTINDNITLGTNGSVCNKIFKVDTLRKNEISFPEGLGTVYMSVSTTVFFLRRKLYNYTRHSGSQMSKNFEKKTLALDDLLIAEKIFKFYQKTGFLKEHKDLFWRQWSDSLWASYRYSGKKYHRKVLAVGKEFIDKNYSANRPSDEGVCNKVNEIRNYNSLYKLKNKVKETLKKGYLKVNRSYRQLDFIERKLEDTHWSFVCLSERLDDLMEEENES